MTKAQSTQIGGSHYTKLKIQPMEYSMQNSLGPAEHTVIKYVTRWKDKGGVEDLKKARHTLDLLIEYTEREQKQSVYDEQLTEYNKHQGHILYGFQSN